MRNPFLRLTRWLPEPLRVVVDWAVTIAGAVVLLLVLKQWVVNPYRIPSSSMEPTLDCALPAQGCLAAGGILHGPDRVLACRICYELSSPARGDVVVFTAPRLAAIKCGTGGTYVKRLVGLPGETVTEDRHGFILIDGRKLAEPYVQPARRAQDVADNPGYLGRSWHVPAGHYFFLGDNRGESCDSRSWGSVARAAIIGKVVATYWPPGRISVA